METATALTALPLETPTGRRAARALVEVSPAARREHVDALIDQRRADLALYRQLLVERDGRAPSLARIEARDRVLIELATIAAL